MIGLNVQCKYADNGTGTVIRKQGKTGYIVEYYKTVPFQSFGSAVVRNEVHKRTVYIKNVDIFVINNNK